VAVLYWLAIKARFDAAMWQSLCQLSNQLAFLFVSLDADIREDRKVNVKINVDCITNLEQHDCTAVSFNEVVRSSAWQLAES
jgi:hypothetical protein